MNKSLKKTLVVVGTVTSATVASAAAIAAPDMADVSLSITNVFGAVLLVAVTIFGFKKVKTLL